MSAAAPASSSRITVPDFVKAKSKGQKLAVVTAYDFLWAGLMDAAGVDAILVGDSLGRASTPRSPPATG
jgi:3-methyl-2-oxobutanoate hydroxymethyltransferase